MFVEKVSKFKIEAGKQIIFRDFYGDSLQMCNSQDCVRHIRLSTQSNVVDGEVCACAVFPCDWAQVQV